MPCYSLIPAYYGEILPSGKRAIVWDRRDAQLPQELSLPCGQCVGCRLERSRQWAVRCMDEASLYEENCFVTLTYSPEKLPKDGGLHKDEFQKFMKRLRKSESGKVIRYYHCGEYGEKLGRPHYHSILFNHDFDDKKVHSERNGFTTFTSEKLDKLWGNGFCLIGSVTFESAAYVARYIMKKINGEPAQAHYQGKQPEYTTMSRRPGIGAGWFSKYVADIFPDDEKIVNGVSTRVPRYYDNLMEKSDSGLFKKIKSRRKIKGLTFFSDNDMYRQKAKEICTLDKLKALTRPMEVVQ